MSLKTLTERHPWTCGDLAVIVAGEHAGIVGEVAYLFVRAGGRVKTMLGIKPQGRPVIEVDADDVIPT